MSLRDYQQQAVDGIFEHWQTHGSTMIVVPTGMGKTHIFGHVIKQMMQQGRCLIIAHREELIQQAVNKVGAIIGEDPVVEMADQFADRDRYFGKSNVVVATVQTLNSSRNGTFRMDHFTPQDFVMVVRDEAHHCVSKTDRRAIEYFQQNENVKLLGVTATPDRHDEEALGQIFQSVAFEYEILQGIQEGWLVDIDQRMVHVHDLDFSTVRTKAGDFHGADLAKILEWERPLHEMVASTVDLVGDRKTLVFAHSVEQARRMAELLDSRYGKRAAFVCAAPLLQSPKPNGGAVWSLPYWISSSPI